MLKGWFLSIVDAPRGGLLCSRHNPSFLQRNGTGSHLYTAHLHTVRSRSLSARSYIAHVGFGSSPLPRSLVSVIIIPHFRGFVKSFFQKRENLFFPRQPSPDGLGDPALTVAVRAVFFIRELNFVIHLITSLSFVPLLYHT
jgi:hypothetical protein